MRWIGAALGLVLLLLGGLWFLQGTGLVTVPPLLCVADCEPVDAPSLQWTLIGAIALAGGAALLWASLHRRK